ncbi:uncharacterized protein LOC120772687 [Bactrocera tryoni]|uniref:uncharacterized protein LOC120772687 n=1 Tax=Bactrocera tryoni TaxID=59916 RepID=UPI001A96FCF0|nr:uncharacterized protein LOC120772687 [Bactrocera tryoni]
MRIISHSIRYGAQAYAANAAHTINKSTATLPTNTATAITATATIVTKQTSTQATNIFANAAPQQQRNASALFVDASPLAVPQLASATTLQAAAAPTVTSTATRQSQTQSVSQSQNSLSATAMLRRSYAAQFRMNCPILIVISLACILHAGLLWHGASAAISNRGCISVLGNNPY